MKTRVCLWKQFLASNLPQTPLLFICLTIFVTLEVQIESLSCLVLDVFLER